MRQVNEPYKRETSEHLQTDRLGSLKVSVKNLLRILNAEQLKEHKPSTQQPSDALKPSYSHSRSNKENDADYGHRMPFSDSIGSGKAIISRRKAVPLGTHASGEELNVSSEHSSLLVEQYLKGEKAKSYKQIWNGIYEDLDYDKQILPDPSPQSRQASNRPVFLKQQLAAETRQLSTEEEDQEDNDIPFLLPSKISSAVHSSVPSPRVTRLVKKQAKPKSTRRSVTALPEDLLDTRIVPETTRRKRRRITTADPTATSKRITEPEPHRFVPMEAVMEYLPALSDPAMLSAVQSIKNRLELTKATATLDSVTSRLVACTRHDCQRLVNRLTKELRLRNDLLHKLDASYSAGQAW